jgi:hypothetical protein
MKLSGLASFLLAWIIGFIYAQEQWPLHNDGINSVVEWYVINLASKMIRSNISKGPLQLHYQWAASVYLVWRG